MTEIEPVNSPFAAIGAMMGGGLPSIDQLPVDKTYCQTCETIAPRIHVFTFSAVVCPECRKVYVDDA